MIRGRLLLTSGRRRRRRSFVCLAMFVLVMGCSADPFPPSPATPTSTRTTATPAPVLSPTLTASPTPPGSIARVGETVTLADSGGAYAQVTVTEVRPQAPESMDNAAQAVPAAERFYGGAVRVYAVRVRIEPIRDLPRFGGTGGWVMLCPGSGSAIGASNMVAAPPDDSYLPTALEGYKAGKTYVGWVMTMARADIPVVLGFIPDVFHDPPQEHPDGSLAWPPPASWIINAPVGLAVPTWAPSLGLCSFDELPST